MGASAPSDGLRKCQLNMEPGLIVQLRSQPLTKLQQTDTVHGKCVQAFQHKDRPPRQVQSPDGYIPTGGPHGSVVREPFRLDPSGEVVVMCWCQSCQRF